MATAAIGILRTEVFMWICFLINGCSGFEQVQFAKKFFCRLFRCITTVHLVVQMNNCKRTVKSDFHRFLQREVVAFIMPRGGGASKKTFFFEGGSRKFAFEEQKGRKGRMLSGYSVGHVR